MAEKSIFPVGVHFPRPYDANFLRPGAPNPRTRTGSGSLETPRTYSPTGQARLDGPTGQASPPNFWTKNENVGKSPKIEESPKIYPKSKSNIPHHPQSKNNIPHHPKSKNNIAPYRKKERVGAPWGPRGPPLSFWRGGAMLFFDFGWWGDVIF